MHGNAVVSFVDVAEGSLLVPLHEVGDAGAARHGHQALVHVLVEGAQLATGAFQLDRHGELFPPFVARHDDHSVARHAQFVRSRRLNRLIQSTHAQLRRFAGQIGEVARHQLSDFIGRRKEQVHLHRLVERGHQLFCGAAGPRAAEVGQIDLEVTLSRHIRSGKAENDGQGDAQPGA